MSRGNPRIGQGLSLEAREQQKIEAAVEARENELDEAALDRQKALVEPEVVVELSQRVQGQEEFEKQVMIDTIREERKRPAQTTAPDSLNPRVKAARAALAPEPEVIVDHEALAAAVERHRVAQETITLAQVELEAANLGLRQAKALHLEQSSARQIQQHRAILIPELAAATRQKAAFQTLFEIYGGAGRNGTTHGPLAKFARTIPSGDAARRDRLTGLYREAAILTDRIRAGYQAAHEAVEATQLALDRGGAGDAADLRLELAQNACTAAGHHDPNVIQAACDKLITDVKVADGIPGPEALRDPRLEDVKSQQFAVGMNGPIIPSEAIPNPS